MSSEECEPFCSGLNVLWSGLCVNVLESNGEAIVQWECYDFLESLLFLSPWSLPEREQVIGDGFVAMAITVISLVRILIWILARGQLTLVMFRWNV